jgi:2,3-bisphosphoglycerate-independent phosphoglycerate mutase
MSAQEVTRQLISKIDATDYQLIVLNFANSDMVGHTGDLKAAIKAIEVLDQCLGKIYEASQTHGYDILLTADHGNSECMVDPLSGNPHTAHTTNPVPVLWCPAQPTTKKITGGILADIAPTILEIYGWPKPADMTGKSLIK